MLRKVLLAAWRHVTRSPLDRVPSWHVPDSLSLWMYPHGPMNKDHDHGSLILLFHEWSAGDVWGLTFTGQFWVHGDQVISQSTEGLEDELLGVFENHQAAAVLIARGKLKRLSEVPSQMLADYPRTSPDLGAWG